MGSSATMTRIVHERAAQEHALRHAARQLERVELAPSPPTGRSALEQPARRRRRSACGTAGVRGLPPPAGPTFMSGSRLFTPAAQGHRRRAAVQPCGVLQSSSNQMRPRIAAFGLNKPTASASVRFDPDAPTTADLARMHRDGQELITSTKRCLARKNASSSYMWNLTLQVPPPAGGGHARRMRACVWWWCRSSACSRASCPSEQRVSASVQLGRAPAGRHLFRPRLFRPLCCTLLRLAHPRLLFLRAGVDDELAEGSSPPRRTRARWRQRETWGTLRATTCRPRGTPSTCSR